MGGLPRESELQRKIFAVPYLRSFITAQISSDHPSKIFREDLETLPGDFCPERLDKRLRRLSKLLTIFKLPRYQFF